MQVSYVLLSPRIFCVLCYIHFYASLHPTYFTNSFLHLSTGHVTDLSLYSLLHPVTFCCLGLDNICHPISLEHSQPVYQTHYFYSMWNMICLQLAPLLLSQYHKVFSRQDMMCLQVAPLLLSQYHKGSSVEGKIVLLQTLTTFLAVCEEKHVTSTSKDRVSFSNFNVCY